jgi:hypothetical protein
MNEAGGRHDWNHLVVAQRNRFAERKDQQRHAIGPRRLWIILLSTPKRLGQTRGIGVVWTPEGPCNTPMKVRNTDDVCHLQGRPKGFVSAEQGICELPTIIWANHARRSWTRSVCICATIRESCGTHKIRCVSTVHHLCEFRTIWEPEGLCQRRRGTVTQWRISDSKWCFILAKTQRVVST